MLADAQSTGMPEVPEELTSSSIAGLTSAVDDLLGSGCKQVGLDCASLSRVSSTHINVLWSIRTKCLERSARLTLNNVNDNLLRVLKVLDLLDMFDLQTSIRRERSVRPKLVPITGPDEEFTIEFTANSSAVASAITELKNRLIQRGLQEKSITELETVFYEVATNIRLHSGISRGETVTVAIALSRREAVMEFKDCGKEFDPTSLPDNFEPSEVINRRQQRGIGVTLIRRMTDDMQYTRENGHFNILTLRKSLERIDE
jgi:anti-sigma regulatory factor (Ser/Thr protein kinase)/ABC-type transporter Mla MlaB component